MVFSRPSPFIVDFVEKVDAGVRRHNPGGRGLSRRQRAWLSVCLMGTIVTNSVCWHRFARACLGRWSIVALCWMFVHASIAWEEVLRSSVEAVLRAHGVTGGTLVIDETDKKRSKKTKKIWGVSKIKDKGSGGYIQGQTLVLLLLVSGDITVPVGFVFYRPDPARSAWAKNDKKLRKKGASKKDRPAQPERNPAYPTKIELALQLLFAFRGQHPDVEVKAVLADAAYSTARFLDTASATFGGVQVVSQLKSNQLVRSRGRKIPLSSRFGNRDGVKTPLPIRGAKTQATVVDSARLHVCSHGKKRFIIALKYEGESEYRYLVASDLTWCTNDVATTWTLRWLIEVFFEDWKGNEGWGTMAKQQGEKGSRRGVILSLLVDHCLLMHPDQLARLKDKRTAFTVGSLVNRIRVDAIVAIIIDIATSGNVEEQLEELSNSMRGLFCLRPSKKHMVNRDLGRQEPSPSLLRCHAVST